MHVLAVNAWAFICWAYLQFEDLAALCEEQDRWTFLGVIAPLRLPAAGFANQPHCHPVTQTQPLT